MSGRGSSAGSTITFMANVCVSVVTEILGGKIVKRKQQIETWSCTCLVQLWVSLGACRSLLHRIIEYPELEGTH